MLQADFFGERALLCDEPRMATVEALTDLTCLVLDRETFIQVLGPWEQVLAREKSPQVRGGGQGFVGSLGHMKACGAVAGGGPCWPMCRKLPICIAVGGGGSGGLQFGRGLQQGAPAGSCSDIIMRELAGLWQGWQWQWQWQGWVLVGGSE